ncbi:MAG: hypothetical protein M1834_008773 [Cirrosporium novae-zelandiae]|nr:MAG: hypothetical protein M1834_008773 [Cirrosporium novae-zelandiae]
MDNFGTSTPQNVEQITKRAQQFEYNPLVPLKYWLRTASTLNKEAEIYEHESNDQQTYFLLFRHAALVLSHLARSPEAQKPEYIPALSEAKRQVKRNLLKLETLRPRINDRHSRYMKRIVERDKRKAVSGELGQLDGELSQNDRILCDQSAVRRKSWALEARENKDLALRIANAAKQAEIDKALGSAQRTGFRVDRCDPSTSTTSSTMTDDSDEVDEKEDLFQRIRQVRLQMDDPKSKNHSIVPSRDNLDHRYHYPLVPTRRAPLDPVAPTLPPKVSISHEERNSVESVEASYEPPPPRPEKPIEFTPAREQSLSSGSMTPDSVADLQPPAPFKPSAYLENGSALRTIFLPPGLRHHFLEVADTNTRANLETCGFLCGVLKRNAFFINTLVIPHQTSTSDTCEMTNESELFDYCDSNELLTLGWIHTHPTQTCFMSSRDLHTHVGYQVMMPESIAIVCAPSKREWGAFRLTDPPGLQMILNCQLPGVFHPHEVDNLYTDTLRPGHMIVMFNTLRHNFEQAFFIPTPTLTEKSLPDQTDKVFIVTGGNTGLGFELCKILYAANSTVYLAGRSESKCLKAVEEIEAACQKSRGNIVWLKLDLGDLGSIKGSVEEFLAKEKRLDVLWNNAGVMAPPRGSKTISGHDLQMGTNCLGPYLLTQLLHPILASTAKDAPSNSIRVCWAGSAAIDVQTPTNGISLTPAGDPIDTNVAYLYGMSKAGNLFLAEDFGRQTEAKGEGIVSVCFNPGNLRSGLVRYIPWIIRVLFNYLYLHPTIYGAYTELWSGLSPELTTGHNGRYIAPWGRLSHNRPDIENVRDEKGEDGIRGMFVKWCRRETGKYI